MTGDGAGKCSKAFWTKKNRQVRTYLICVGKHSDWWEKHIDAFTEIRRLKYEIVIDCSAKGITKYREPKCFYRNEVL